MKNLILKRGDSIASRGGGKHLLSVNGYVPLNRVTLNLVPRALFPGFGGPKAREKRPGDEVG